MPGTIGELVGAKCAISTGSPFRVGVPPLCGMHANLNCSLQSTWTQTRHSEHFKCAVPNRILVIHINKMKKKKNCEFTFSDNDDMCQFSGKCAAQICANVRLQQDNCMVSPAPLLYN